MKRLLTRCDHVLQAAHLANVLRAAGIAVEVRNTTLASALGEIPFLDCAPQLWLDSPLDEPRARELLAAMRQPAAGPAWTCAGCGERGEPQFGQCWQCGRARED